MHQYGADSYICPASGAAGYCSVVEFEEHELGMPVAESALPQHIVDVLRAAAKGVPCREGGATARMPRTAEVWKLLQANGRSLDHAFCSTHLSWQSMHLQWR